MFKEGDRVSYKQLDWSTDEEVTKIATIVAIVDPENVKVDNSKRIINVTELTRVPEVRSSPFGSII